MEDKFLEFVMYKIQNIFPDYINFNIVNLSIEEKQFVVSAIETKKSSNVLLYFSYNDSQDSFTLVKSEKNGNLKFDKFADDNLVSIKEVNELFEKFILSELGTYNFSILEKMKLRNIILNQKFKG